MLITQQIIDRVKSRLKEKGAELQSRQAEVILEVLAEEIERVEDRISVLEDRIFG